MCEHNEIQGRSEDVAISINSNWNNIPSSKCSLLTPGKHHCLVDLYVFNIECREYRSQSRSQELSLLCVRATKRRRKKESKTYISLLLSHKHLWFPLTRQATQGTTGVCVCVGVCACLWPSKAHWLNAFLGERQEKEREKVSKIVETLICHLTNHKGQSLYFWQEAPWEQTGRKWGRTGGSNVSQREKSAKYEGQRNWGQMVAGYWHY